MKTIKEIKLAKAKLEKDILNMMHDFMLENNINEIELKYDNKKADIQGEVYQIGANIKVTINI